MVSSPSCAGISGSMPAMAILKSIWNSQFYVSFTLGEVTHLILMELFVKYWKTKLTCAKQLTVLFSFLFLVAFCILAKTKEKGKIRPRGLRDLCLCSELPLKEGVFKKKKKKQKNKLRFVLRVTTENKLQELPDTAGRLLHEAMLDIHGNNEISPDLIQKRDE